MDEHNEIKKINSSKIHTTRIWNILIEEFYKLNEKIVFKDNLFNYNSLTSFRKLNRKLWFISLMRYLNAFNIKFCIFS